MSGESQRLSDVEREVSQLTSVVDRIDMTLTKLTDLSTTVSQILAVQGNRLEVQEKVGEKLEKLIETRRLENESSFKDIQEKISLVETDLHEDIQNNHEKVITEIKELRKEGTTQHTELSNRMTRIERWMWTFVGAGLVIGFILDKLNFLGLFT
jgi:septation ring formation regulator EzrA